MHECKYCGQMCTCDMEDHGQPQPNDCVHLTAPNECEDFEEARAALAEQEHGSNPASPSKKD